MKGARTNRAPQRRIFAQAPSPRRQSCNFGLLHTIEKAADIYGRARAMNGGSGEFLNTITDEGLRQIGREFNVKINEAMLDFPAASATDN